MTIEELIRERDEAVSRAQEAEARAERFAGMLLSGISMFEGGEMRTLSWQEALYRCRADALLWDGRRR